MQSPFVRDPVMASTRSSVLQLIQHGRSSSRARTDIASGIEVRLQPFNIHASFSQPLLPSLIVRHRALDTPPKCIRVQPLVKVRNLVNDNVPRCPRQPVEPASRCPLWVSHYFIPMEWTPFEPRPGDTITIALCRHGSIVS
jgi:hypothetical protein